MLGLRDRNALADSEVRPSSSTSNNNAGARTSSHSDKHSSSPFANVQTNRYFSQVKRTSSLRNQMLTDADITREITNILLPGKASKIIVEGPHGNFCIGDEYSLACGRWTPEAVESFLTFNTEYRRNVRAMHSFVESRSTRTELIPFSTTLKGFLEELSEEISGLLTPHESDKTNDTSAAKLRLSWIERRVDRVYRFLLPLLESRETVDATWDRFFQALSIFPDLDDDLPVWKKLYSLMMSQMLSYFDEVSEARIEAVFNDDEDSTSKSPPTFAKARLSFRRLWSPALYDNMVAAIRHSSRITTHGEKLPLKRRFSDILLEKLAAATGDAETEHRLTVLTKALEEAAEAYGKQFSDYLFTRLQENGLLESRLREIKFIYSFTTLCGYVNRVYENDGAFRSVADRLVDVQKALHSQTLDNDAWKRWKLTCADAETHFAFRVEPKLEWPLPYVLSNDLFDALNGCLLLLLKVTYALNSATATSLHANLGRISREYDSARAKRYLCSLMTQFTSHLYSALINQIKILLDRNIAQLLKANSVVEMEECVAEWSSQTNEMLDSNSMEGLYVHTVVDGMAALIEQFRSASESLSDAKVEKMVNKVHRLQSLITASSGVYAGGNPIVRVAGLISRRV